MDNLEKYTLAFTSTFDINPEQAAVLSYQSIEAWDSIGHMGLMAALEEAFDIMMEPDDIIDFSSFEKGREILKKYNVEI